MSVNSKKAGRLAVRECIIRFNDRLVFKGLQFYFHVAKLFALNESLIEIIVNCGISLWSVENRD